VPDMALLAVTEEGSRCSSAMSSSFQRLPLGMKAGLSMPKVSPQSNLFFSSFQRKVSVSVRGAIAWRVHTSRCSSAMSSSFQRLPLGMKAGLSMPKVSPQSNLFFSSFQRKVSVSVLC
jgi:hypothetical protein